MVGQGDGRAGWALQALVSVVLAAALVAAATLGRAALTPVLGAASPFMLYVGAVLAAGLVRGPFCGGLVMLTGGVVGLLMFMSPHGTTAYGAVPALMLFWCVSAPVLVTANELRVQLGRAMTRLSSALQRRGTAP